MSSFRLFAACALMWLAAGSAAMAEPAPSPSPSVAPLVTNRPTQATNTNVVGPGVFQVELGLNELTYKGKGNPPLFQVFTQFRAGLGTTTELSIAAPLYNLQSGVSGFGDTAVELKWQFAEHKLANGNSAILAVIPNVTIPTGGHGFSAGGLGGQVIMSADLPVGKNGQDWTINLAGASVFDAASGKRFGQLFVAAYYTYNITPTLQHFVEVSGVGPDRSSGGAFLPSIDTGLEMLVGIDNQVDITLLKGLGARGPDYLITLGFSHRFR